MDYLAKYRRELKALRLKLETTRPPVDSFKKRVIIQTPVFDKKSDTFQMLESTEVLDIHLVLFDGAPGVEAECLDIGEQIQAVKEKIIQMKAALASDNKKSRKQVLAGIE